MANFLLRKNPVPPKWPWRIVPYVDGLWGVMYVHPPSKLPVFEFPDGSQYWNPIRSASGATIRPDPYIQGYVAHTNATPDGFWRIDLIPTLGDFAATTPRAWVHRWTRVGGTADQDSDGLLVCLNQGHTTPYQGIQRSTSTSTTARIYHGSGTYTDVANFYSTSPRTGFESIVTYHHGSPTVDQMRFIINNDDGVITNGAADNTMGVAQPGWSNVFRITWGCGPNDTPISNGDHDAFDTHLFHDIGNEFEKIMDTNPMYWQSPETRYDAYEEYGRTAYFIFPSGIRSTIFEDPDVFHTSTNIFIGTPQNVGAGPLHVNENVVQQSHVFINYYPINRQRIQATTTDAFGTANVTNLVATTNFESPSILGVDVTDTYLLINENNDWEIGDGYWNGSEWVRYRVADTSNEDRTLVDFSGSDEKTLKITAAAHSVRRNFRPWSVQQFMLYDTFWANSAVIRTEINPRSRNTGSTQIREFEYKYHPFVLERSQWYEQIGFHLATASANTSARMLCGIYENVNGYPGRRIAAALGTASINEVNLNTTGGSYAVLEEAVHITRGYYILVMVSNANSGNFRTNTTDNSEHYFSGVNTNWALRPAAHDANANAIYGASALADPFESGRTITTSNEGIPTTFFRIAKRPPYEY